MRLKKKRKKKVDGRRELNSGSSWLGLLERDDRDLGHLTRRSIACPTARNSTGHTRKHACPRVSRTVVSVVCWCRFQRALPARSRRRRFQSLFVYDVEAKGAAVSPKWHRTKLELNLVNFNTSE